MTRSEFSSTPALPSVLQENCSSTSRSFTGGGGGGQRGRNESLCSNNSAAFGSVPSNACNSHSYCTTARFPFGRKLHATRLFLFFFPPGRDKTSPARTPPRLPILQNLSFLRSSAHAAMFHQPKFKQDTGFLSSRLKKINQALGILCYRAPDHFPTFSAYQNKYYRTVT